MNIFRVIAIVSMLVFSAACSYKSIPGTYSWLGGGGGGYSEASIMLNGDSTPLSTREMQRRGGIRPVSQWMWCVAMVGKRRTTWLCRCMVTGGILLPAFGRYERMAQ